MKTEMPSTQRLDSADSGIVPQPGPSTPQWKAALLKICGEHPEARWGSQLIRIAQDMILVSDEELRLCYHNQAFVRGLGFRDGSYVGMDLLSLFPGADRSQAKEAFATLGSGRMRGIAVEASFLTTSSPLAFEAQVTRSLRGNGSYYFYMIARPAGISSVAQKPALLEPESKRESIAAVTDLLSDLPIAAWRADSEHRLIELTGKLWDDLDVDHDDVIGAELGRATCPRIPEILTTVKPSLRAPTRPSVSDVEFRGKHYSIAIEPMRGDGGKYLGSVGYLRPASRAKPTASDTGPVAGKRTTTLVVGGGSGKVTMGPPKAAKARAFRTESAPTGETTMVGMVPRSMTPPPALAEIKTTRIGVGSGRGDEIALPG